MKSQWKEKDYQSRLLKKGGRNRRIFRRPRHLCLAANFFISFPWRILQERGISRVRTIPYHSVLEVLRVVNKISVRFQDWAGKIGAFLEASSGNL